jgi:hypothetical protein
MTSDLKPPKASNTDCQNVLCLGGHDSGRLLTLELPILFHNVSCLKRLLILTALPILFNATPAIDPEWSVALFRPPAETV